MRNNKRRLLIGCLMLFLLLSVCACGRDSVQDNSEGLYTRGEWIMDLGLVFGYDQYLEDTQIFKDVSTEMDCYGAVQACAEWEVIEREEQFYPDNEITWGMALDSVVRAIGLERLQQAGYDVEPDATATFFLQNIAQVEIQDFSETITREEAVQVINFASDFENGLVFPQMEEIVFQDSVKELTEQDICLRGDGETAIILKEAEYQVGDVLYLTDSVTGEESALRVETVENNMISYSEATADDVFSSVSVHGTYSPEISEVIVGSAEQTVFSVDSIFFGGNDPYMQNPIYIPREENNVVVPIAAKVDVSVNKNSATFKVYDTKGNWSAEAGIEDIKVNVDFDYRFPTTVKTASVTVSYSDYVKLQAEMHEAQTIPLGTIKLPICTGVTVDLSFFLNIGVDGEASIVYTSDVTTGVYYVKGKSVRNKLSNDNATLDFKAEVTATVEPLVKADLKFLGSSVINAKVTTGIVASAVVEDDLLDDNPACCDVKAFVPLKWSVNEDNCIASMLLGKKATIKKTVWDSTNSPFQWHWHYEGFVEVAECTMGDDIVEAPLVTEEGAPLDEYKIFEFEEISFGMIRLTSYTVYMEQGEILPIGFQELPNNITQDKLTYEILDSTNVCSVNNAGMITAMDAGATNIKISTEDEKYSTYLTVVVAENYNDTSDFVPLQ